LEQIKKSHDNKVTRASRPRELTRKRRPRYFV
jgi:hypothetical protein